VNPNNSSEEVRRRKKRDELIKRAHLNKEYKMWA
jgi:hypothetical protein